ncbi:response regulator transcription factor [Candidatus Shapirobacteria bacterium]|nr:response regulator transcription factor [Candidatus Shapirobacteria bacterium]
MRILVIEDDVVLAKNLEIILKNSGYAVDVACTVVEATNKNINAEYDLIILDINLPDGSGVDWCKEIRSEGQKTKVLMLTAKSQVEDKIEGLDGGADEYMTKPFRADELNARIRALLRRQDNLVTPKISLDKLLIDTNLKEVWYKNKKVVLSPKEYGLLEYLAMRPGVAVTREELMEHVWDENVNIFSNTVDVHIRGLRDKIDEKLLVTVKNKGYALKV